MVKNYIKIAKKSALVQISELRKIKKVFNKSFEKAVEQISSCKGKVQLKMSMGSFHLKGSGWYKDGYVKKPKVEER